MTKPTALKIAHQYCQRKCTFRVISQRNRAKLLILTSTHLQPCPSFMKPEIRGAKKLLPQRANEYSPMCVPRSCVKYWEDPR
jgi:hypothetical protein